MKKDDIEIEFTNLLLENKHIIYRVCFIYSNDRDEVNDLYQEAVFRIWKAYKGFNNQSKFSTWIYRITLNTCISYLRKNKGKQYVTLSENIDIWEDCEHNEMLKEMYLLIKNLNQIDRMYILLWLDEKSYEEIAEIVGTTKNNVATKIFRIKEKLKTMSNQ